MAVTGVQMGTASLIRHLTASSNNPGGVDLVEIAAAADNATRQELAR